VKTSLQNILDIFAEPSAAFARLTAVEKPLWGTAYLLLCLAFLFVAWGRAPYEEHILSQSGQPTDVAGFQIGLIIVLGGMRCVGALIEPVLLGAILTGGTRIFKRGAVKFHQIFAILIHLLLIRALGELVNTALLLVFRDVASVTNPADMQLLPGLHHIAFFIDETKLRYLLSSFHLVAFWELTCLTIAIRVVAAAKRWQALLVTACIWILSVVLSLIFLLASRS